MAMVKILIVCTGNICRSPTAHGFLEQALSLNNLSDHVGVESAGLSNGHIGHSPDERTSEAAKKHGVDLSHLRARGVTPQDYEDFDLILAMDQGHLEQMKAQAPSDKHDKIQLYLDFTDLPKGSEVPDPYYGGDQGFDLVINLIKKATPPLVKHIKNTLA